MVVRESRTFHPPTTAPQLLFLFDSSTHLPLLLFCFSLRSAFPRSPEVPSSSWTWFICRLLRSGSTPLRRLDECIDVRRRLSFARSPEVRTRIASHRISTLSPSLFFSFALLRRSLSLLPFPLFSSSPSLPSTTDWRTFTPSRPLTNYVVRQQFCL